VGVRVGVGVGVAVAVGVGVYVGIVGGGVSGIGAGSAAKAKADRITRITPATMARGNPKSKNLWVCRKNGSDFMHFGFYVHVLTSITPSIVGKNKVPYSLI